MPGQDTGGAEKPSVALWLAAPCALTQTLLRTRNSLPRRQGVHGWRRCLSAPRAQPRYLRTLGAGGLTLPTTSKTAPCSIRGDPQAAGWARPKAFEVRPRSETQPCTEGSPFPGKD